jgi:hypothetical protein
MYMHWPGSPLLKMIWPAATDMLVPTLRANCRMSMSGRAPRPTDDGIVSPFDSSVEI